MGYSILGRFLIDKLNNVKVINVKCDALLGSFASLDTIFILKGSTIIILSEILWL